MSILIKDMEMPEHCGYCRFRYDGICHALQKTQYRKEECPLVPVPPHCRLVDADALMNLIREHSYPLTDHFNSTDNGMFTIGIQQAVDEAPAIIEKEET